MVLSCVAYNCTNRYDKNNPNIGFHRFPFSKPDLLMSWISAIRRKNWQPSKASVLCSLHFLTEDFEPFLLGSRYRKLKPAAVPSVFDFSADLGCVKKRKVLEQHQNITDEVIMGKNYCCVPGCKSGCLSEREKYENEGKKNIILFAPPLNDELFEKWKRAIPKSDYEFTRNDRVCELHFLKDDIEKFHVTKDGNINVIKKGNIGLKSGAVPSIFPSPSLYATNIVTKRIFPKAQHSELLIPKEEREDLTYNIDKTSDDTINTDASLTETNLSTVEKMFSYQKLLKTVMLIKKPSDLWSITASSNFIICARWNEKYVSEKRIVIEKNLNVRVFLRDEEINIMGLVEITCDDDLSTLLEKVESYKMCIGGSNKS